MLGTRRVETVNLDDVVLIKRCIMYSTTVSCTFWRPALMENAPPQLKLYHEIVDSLVRSAPKLLCPGTRADFQTKKYVHTFEHQRTSFGALTVNIIIPHHSALPQL